MWQHPKLEYTQFTQHDFLLHPIYRLPFELLSRIFEFSTYIDWYQRLPVIDTTCKNELLGAAVTVSHVCRHWRDIVVFTPSLWTNIIVFTSVARPPYNLVSLYLERSRSHPIDVIVMELPSKPESSYTDATFLYTLLTPQIHRWRSVNLLCAKSSLLSAFLAAVSHPSTPSASRLESLTLEHHPLDMMVYHTNPLFYDHYTIFNDSVPQLKHLVLSGIHVHWGQSWIAAASNLTTLEIFNNIEHVRPFWIEFATILRGAPRLQKLALFHSAPRDHPDGWVFDPSTTSTPDELNTPIPLLHLQELVVGGQSEEVAIALLQELYMPALTTLILDFEDGDYGDFVCELLVAATSLTPPSAEDDQPSLLMGLERLAILNLVCEEVDLIVTMLEHLENLKALRLSPRVGEEGEGENPDFALEMLRQLVRTTIPGEAINVPRLETLIICPGGGDIHLLRDVVQSRKNAGVPLKSLFISMDEDMGPDDTIWFGEQLEEFWFAEDVHCCDTERAFEGELL